MAFRITEITGKLGAKKKNRFESIEWFALDAICSCFFFHYFCCCTLYCSSILFELIVGVFFVLLSPLKYAAQSTVRHCASESHYFWRKFKRQMQYSAHISNVDLVIDVNHSETVSASASNECLLSASWQVHCIERISPNIFCI